MQPLILLAIVAVGAVALGTGFLAPIIPNMTVQNIGVGDKDLLTPLSNVKVDLDVEATLVNPDADTTNLPGDEFYKNAITECSWHIGLGDLANGETDIEEVICKITGEATNDQDNVAIGECNKEYPESGAGEPDYPFSSHEFCTPVEAYPGAMDIDNVGDVRIVVRGSNPTVLPVLP